MDGKSRYCRDVIPFSDESKNHVLFLKVAIRFLVRFHNLDSEIYMEESNQECVILFIFKNF